MRKINNFNCASAALKLEERALEWVICPDWRTPPIESIKNLASDFGLKARVINTPDVPLEKGEWVIVFWGFYARNCYDPDDYSGGMWNCVPNQFHFGYLSENGKWMERIGVGEPLVEFDLDSKIFLFRSVRLEPTFFAVKAKLAPA